MKKRKITIGGAAAFAYVCFMSAVFPLIFHNNYIDIQSTKYRVFAVAAGVFLIVTAAAGLIAFIKKKGTEETSGDSENGRSFLQWLLVLFALIFAAALIIGTLMTEQKTDALTGAAGRNMGMISWLLCIGTGLAIAWQISIKKVLFYIFSAGSAVLSLFAILNFWGVDPLGMYENLVDAQHSYFISTIGNINVCSGYLCIAVPVLLACFYYSERKGDQIFFGAVSAAAVYAGFSASSDSFLMGSAGMFLMILFLSLSAPDKMKKFWNCCILYFLTVVLFRLTLSAGAGQVSAFREVYPSEGLIGFVLKPAVLSAAGVILALLICAERFFLSKRPERYPAIRKGLFTAFGILLAIFIILLIIANASSASVQEGSSFLKRFVITDEFGSLRGYIWKRSLMVFSDLSFPQKLFGCGPDCFYYAVVPEYGMEMATLYSTVFTDAHCEFLQMLVTTGIVGTAGYFGILIWSLSICIRGSRKHFLFFAGSMLLASWLIQGVANHPQIAVTPVLFVFLGLIGAASLEKSGSFSPAFH